MKTWKRKFERAQELKLVIPDPSVLLSRLDMTTDKVIKRDQRRCFRIDCAREAIKVDVVTSFEAVEKLALLLESELEEMVSTSWSTVGPKVKSMKGTPKGKNGKDGKNNDSKRKIEKMEKEEAKSNPVIFSQRPKKDATKVNSAQDTSGC